jgi:thiamine biosynthesis lipoprotein
MPVVVLQRERVWHRASARVMSTTVEILVDGDPSLVSRAFGRLRGLEQRLSRFDPTSELNRALARPDRWVTISSDLRRALSWSQRLHRETGGLFDPAIRPRLEAWGYDRTFSEVVDDGAAPTPMAATDRPSIQDVEIDREHHRVRIPAGLSLDLGGVGKGLASEIVATELVEWGAVASYVSAGGDIHAAGDYPDEGWIVPLEHPGRDGVDAVVAEHRLLDGGLVMSSTAVRRWRRGQRSVHHLIDPRTGDPAETDLVAVAVATASSARAEALAKAALIAGSDAGRSLLQQAGVTAWMLSPESVEEIS